DAALARRAAEVRLGREFRDALAGGGEGPSMVVVTQGDTLDAAAQAVSTAPIDRAQFDRFIAASGHRPTDLASLYRSDSRNLPRDSVAPADAEAYARWLTAATGRGYHVARIERTSDLAVRFWVGAEL
ncbi:MAG: formylglycine-generating enzyme family protein, partial [Gammaproteobacteria bacterium]|nr:formylglycine-generating enzyme family protein [Gammaproteobacteria bacterium]